MTADPWEIDPAAWGPDPFATTTSWTGRGLCAQHGAYPASGCPSCPPDGHPLQARERERAAAHLPDRSPAVLSDSSRTERLVTRLLLAGTALLFLVACVVGPAWQCDRLAGTAQACESQP